MEQPEKLLTPDKPVRRFPLRPHQLVHEITPVSDVFVLAVLGVPQVDLASWRLEVAGLVERPRTFCFDDLLKLPKRELQALHECAGNPMNPTLPTRRIANVIWGGVDVAAVLDLVGVKKEAAFLWMGGLDRGVYRGHLVDSYVKDAPLEDALREGILAYELNGEPLPPEYGYPVRFVLPGFYGTNSVKWLCRLELADARAKSIFTTTYYNDLISPSAQEPDGESRPVWKTAPESVIVSPGPDAQLSGPSHEIWGRAWAHHGVRQVEVSVDGGASWRIAELGAATQRSWQKFRLLWRPEHPGKALLLSRADRKSVV